MYRMLSTFVQLVNRFLWRNLKVGREPGTNVKAIPTLGDRRSPAMAIVALHKKAKLKEEGEPTSAESIMKNTYMDDICDAVNSVAEVNELMSAIDSVLANRGVNVKG